jgi:hypothetical protein
MTITAILRGAAVTLALLGFIDPPWTMHRQAPVPVDVRAASDVVTPSDAGLLDEVRSRVRSTLVDRVIVDSAAEPTAVVLVGHRASARALPDGDLPISTVGPLPSSSGVRILLASSPAPVPLGWSATVEATLEANGLRGTTSRIVLQQGDAELAHVDHAWTNDRERFDVRLSYAPPVEGSSRVTLKIDDKSEVDLRATAIGRRLKVLAHEPRPSWMTAFVRRALEDDAIFDVASLVRSSRSLSVRGGSPPPALTADALSAFDVVLVGAPEDLRAGEIEALRWFARTRGGTVVLLPDRRPSGPYLQLTPATSFEEMLVDAPLELKTVSGATFPASELAIPRDGLRAADTLASLVSQQTSKPVIVAWPAGIGTIVFSGALDAWRYRATAGEGFARFWRTRIAEAALAAPPRVQVAVTPEIARPGEDVIVRARLRPTELATSVPAVRAIAVGPHHQQEDVRLWPTAEAGVFEGRLRAPALGTIDVQVTADNGAVGDDILTVVADARHPEDDAPESLALVAASTGGVAVNAADLGPLERYLRGLPSASVAQTYHPSRSLWFVVTFAGLCCSEWALRRRRGQL